MYALIEFAGKQFKVEEGNSIKVPYIDGKIGSKITIDKILYMDDGKNKMVGNPLIPGFKINVLIEELCSSIGSGLLNNVSSRATCIPECS